MNNILLLKYAVEVDRTRSISKAAKNLYMGQPHLSKAIKELEDSIGCVLFARTPKGVEPTDRGREFLEQAKNIIAQMDQLDVMFREPEEQVYKLAVSVPRASYISEAFSRVVEQVEDEENFQLNYRETNSVRAIKNVTDGINNIAIIRYLKSDEDYFRNALKERDLNLEVIWEFRNMVTMSQDHPLAGKDKVEYQELLEYTEIVHGDNKVPSLSVLEHKEREKNSQRKKKISVYERGSQLELLSSIPTAYMWGSLAPSEVLDRFGLVQKPCDASEIWYRDIFICRKGYRLTKLDMMFVQTLRDVVSELSAGLPQISGLSEIPWMQ